MFAYIFESRIKMNLHLKKKERYMSKNKIGSAEFVVLNKIVFPALDY